MASLVADVQPRHRLLVSAAARTVDDDRISCYGAICDVDAADHQHDHCCQLPPLTNNPFPSFVDISKSKEPVTMVKLRRLWTRPPSVGRNSTSITSKSMDDDDLRNVRRSRKNDVTSISNSTNKTITSSSNNRKGCHFRSFSSSTLLQTSKHGSGIRLDSGSNSDQHYNTAAGKKACLCNDEYVGTTPVPTPVATPPIINKAAVDDVSGIYTDFDAEKSNNGTKKKKSYRRQQLVHFETPRSNLMRTKLSPCVWKPIEDNCIPENRVDKWAPGQGKEDYEGLFGCMKPDRMVVEPRIAADAVIADRYFSFEPLSAPKATSVPVSPFLSPMSDVPSLLCSPTCPGHAKNEVKASKKSHGWISCSKIACFSPQPQAKAPKVYYYGEGKSDTYVAKKKPRLEASLAGRRQRMDDVLWQAKVGDFSAPATEKFSTSNKPSVSHDDDSAATFVFHSMRSVSEHTTRPTSEAKYPKTHLLRGNQRPPSYTGATKPPNRIYGSSTLISPHPEEKLDISSKKGLPTRILQLFFGPMVAIGSQLLADIRLHKVDTWRGPRVVCMYPGGFGVVLGAPLEGPPYDFGGSEESSLEEGSF